MSRPGDLDLDRGGDLRKPRTHKPSKTCRECGRKFNTRSKHTLHLLAHKIIEDEECEMTVEEAEKELQELQRQGLLHRVRDGFIVEDEEPQ